MANKMPVTMFNKYRGAARKCCFFDVPFKFAASNFTIAELAEVKKLAESYAAGTADERLNKACQELRARKNLKSAQQQVVKQGYSVFPARAPGESSATYCQRIVTEILAFLDRPEVILAMGEAADKKEKGQVLYRVAICLRNCLRPPQPSPPQTQ
jgi:hypothetical protein